MRSFQRLLGCEVVVVGKPITPHEHVDMYLTCLGDGIVLLGDPAAGRALLERILSEEPEPALPGFDSWTIPAQRAAQSLYDEIQFDLTARGLKVVRVPVLHGEHGGLLTWNNALVERRGSERRAYVPVYGVPLLDDAAIRAYRGAGCQVFPIDVTGIAATGGTVRCITNVVGWSLPRPAPAPR